MDEEINIKELKNIVKKFCDDRDWDKFHNAKDLAIGVATEASELLEHFRFKSESEIANLFKNQDKLSKISEEIADVFYFLLRFCQKYNIDLSEALIDKIKKNEARYGVEKFKGSNRKYNDE